MRHQGNGNQKISIVGAGIVGQAWGRVLLRAGFSVLFVDTDPLRLKDLTKEGLRVTADLNLALDKTDHTFICVPTPSRQSDGAFDGRAVASVASEIFRFLERTPRQKRLAKFHMITVKSTVLPEYMGHVQKLTALQLGKDYGLAVNPEFLRSETAEKDVLHNEVVIGAQDKRSARTLEGVYKTLKQKLGCRFRFIRTDFAAASLMKYKHNLWLTSTMGFLLEFAGLCKSYGVNPYEIIYTTSNHDPAKWIRDDFLSNGFLDECLPKDSSALLRSAERRGILLPVLESALRVNEAKIRKNSHLPYDLQRLQLLRLTCENGNGVRKLRMAVNEPTS